MASFKAKYPVLQELSAKNHSGGGPLPPPPAGRGLKVCKKCKLLVKLATDIPNIFLETTGGTAPLNHHRMCSEKCFC